MINKPRLESQGVGDGINEVGDDINVPDYMAAVYSREVQFLPKLLSLLFPKHFHFHLLFL